MPKRREDINDDQILSAFAETGILNKVAESLGVTRMTIYNRIKESPSLKKKIEKIKQKIRSKKPKAVVKYEDKTRITSVSIKQRAEGRILSDEMQVILNNTKGEGVSIYSLLNDQLNLRAVMINLEDKYKKDKIDDKEYTILIMQLHKVYAIVTKAYEEIALKKLGDKTQAEIYEETYRYFAKVFDVLEEIAVDEKIPRDNIAREVKDRINWYGEEE